MYKTEHSRIFDNLDRLILANAPGLPFRVSEGHATEDHLRHLQSGVAETD